MYLGGYNVRVRGDARGDVRGVRGGCNGRLQQAVSGVFGSRSWACTSLWLASTGKA